MLQAPWQWSRNEGQLWMYWVGAITLVFILVAGGSSVAGQPLLPGAPWLLGVLLWTAVGLAALLVWTVQFSGFLRLDHPHAARFVPGHRRALRAAALGTWLAISGLAGLLAALLPVPGLGWRYALLLFLIAALALLWVAVSLRWAWCWLLLWPAVLVFEQPVVRAALRPVSTFVQACWVEVPALCVLVALPAMGWVLSSLFGRANGAHASAYASREHLRKAMRGAYAGQRLEAPAHGAMDGVLQLQFLRRWAANAWLARIVHNAKPQRASVMSRAALVLYGHAHWVSQASAGLLLAMFGGVLAAVLHFALGLWTVAPMTEQLVISLVAMASSAVGGWLWVTPGALWSSRREQALLMLLPSMPQGVALNRAIAWQQIKYCAVSLLAVAPILAVATWWTGMTHALGFAGAAILLGFLLWRDVSHARAPQLSSTMAMPALWLVLGLLFMLFLRWQPALLLPWALGLLALTAALLAWRWRRLAQWPQALPAGRLG